MEIKEPTIFVKMDGGEEGEEEEMREQESGVLLCESKISFGVELEGEGEIDSKEVRVEMVNENGKKVDIELLSNGNGRFTANFTPDSASSKDFKVYYRQKLLETVPVSISLPEFTVEVRFLFIYLFIFFFL